MRTKIEWVRNEDGSQGFTINPIKGLCLVDCKDNVDQYKFCLKDGKYRQEFPCV